MLPERGPLRAIFTTLTAVVATVAGVFAWRYFETSHFDRWSGGATTLPEQSIVYAAAVLAVIAGSNLLLRAKWRVLPFALVLSFCTLFAVYSSLHIIFSTFWRPSAPFWHGPAVSAITIGSFVPGVWLGWKWPRQKPRPALDASLFVVVALILIVMLVPFERMRIASMNDTGRHAAAVLEFGDIYLRAKAILEACSPIAAELGTEPVFVASTKRNRIWSSDDVTAGEFTFLYRGQKETGTASIRLIQRSGSARQAGESEFSPSRRTLEGDYVVLLSRTGDDRGDRITCSQPEGGD